MTTLSDSHILNQTQIAHKIRRMAYQIYEANVNEKEIILAGIAKSGYTLAQRIKSELDTISNINTVLGKVEINKKKPLEPIKTDLSPDIYENKSMVLVDDVLHSGATLIYAVKYFLDRPLKQFKTAVLVDRNHKKYPIKADYKGISLSTSLNESVQVHFGKEDWVELV